MLCILTIRSWHFAGFFGWENLEFFSEYLCDSLQRKNALTNCMTPVESIYHGCFPQETYNAIQWELRHDWLYTVIN